MTMMIKKNVVRRRCITAEAKVQRIIQSGVGEHVINMTAGKVVELGENTRGEGSD